MAAYAALVSVIHIMDDLEHHPRPPISLPKDQVHLLTQKITFLQQFLEGYNPNLAYTAEADPLETRITDAAYAAEDVIESHIVDSITSVGEKMSSDDVFHEAIEKVIEQMALIEKEAMLIKLETVRLQRDQLHTKLTPPDASTTSSTLVAHQSRMVGADHLLLEMKDKLTSDRLNLQIIPIVGMGGSGKTTLAINIYQDRLIEEHFRFRAWVTIAQEDSIQSILEQLLKQLDVQVSQKLRDDGKLGDTLHKHLFGRKYLVVFDDMWNIRTWEGIRMFLPNNTNGSRIVVTTRLSNLASTLPNSHSLKMNLLDEDDSWDLLSKTVFGEKDCPLDFQEIGKEIGKSCKGLPLSIIVVGGLLAKSTLTREFWEYTKQNLNAVVNLEDGERYLKILHMSYKQLPVHLKPCFLYMGVFPEDKEIVISKLIKLWVAEGFLKPVSERNMEEIAKEYLEDLVGRNLIMVHKLGRLGDIKECKIHDLLRDLCLREAEKQRFYSVVASQPSRPQGIVNAAQRRIVVSSSASKKDAINALSSMPLARSLIWHLEGYKLPSLNLRLLRVFELSSTRSYITQPCLESIHQSVNSRYLNIADSKCPHSIRRFWNLQLLCCKSWATFISDMIRIRHIQSDERTDLENDQFQGDNVLGNLQTLGPLSNFKCSKEIVRRIPSVKELVLYYLETFYQGKYCLNNLVHLDKLESLNCIFRHSGPPNLHSLINFPNSLKKLSLSFIYSSKCWEEILEKIGSLPLLEKLKLQGGSFEEGQWETTQGHFRSLRILVIHWCKGLKLWKTDASHFPRLERLRLDQVWKLEEIPLDLADIPTLKVIEVFCCSTSAVESAKRIVEEQEDLYGQEATLQVHVTLSKLGYPDNNIAAVGALESLAAPNFCVTHRHN